MADTAARLAISARRNEVARFTIAVTGIDMTGVAMAMQIRLGRDVPGEPLIALATVSTLAAEGLKLDSVTVTNGVPTSIIKGRINASTMTDATKVPYAGEMGDNTTLAYAMQWTLNGDAQTRLYGDFVVLGSAFGSDNAPTNRPLSYSASSVAGGSSGGSLTFGDQIIQVTISDAALVGAIAALASDAATCAQNSAASIAAAASIISTLGAIVTTSASPYAFSIVDSTGGAIVGYDASGWHFAGNVAAITFNGVDPAKIGQPAPVLPARIIAPRVFDIFTGQSNSNGNSQEIGLTNQPAYDCIGFAWQSNNPANYFPLTVANTQALEPGHPRGESFMYSTARRTIDLLIERHGKTAQNKGYQVLAVNNGLSSQAIEYFDKGGTHYNLVESQMQAAKAISAAEGITCLMGSMFFDQGEQGSADYKAKLKQQAIDYDALAREVFPANPPFKRFCMQTSSSADKASAIAQWQASKESSLIRLVGPTYPYTFGPNAFGIHRDAAGQGAAGDMAAEARNDEEIAQRGPWQSLDPTITVQGRVITMRFNRLIRPDGSLTEIFFDGPAVSGGYRGFNLVDANTQVLGMSVPVKVGPDTLVAIADADIPAGARMVTGYATALNRTDSYIGYATELRDNYGDKVIVNGVPLHRWCAFFDLPIPAQG